MEKYKTGLGHQYSYNVRLLEKVKSDLEAIRMEIADNPAAFSVACLIDAAIDQAASDIIKADDLVKERD